MAAQKGRVCLLQIGDDGSPMDFVTIGGGRVVTLRLNNQMVDITDQSSAGVRELLAAAGTSSLTMTIAGVFKDTASETTLSETAGLTANFGAPIGRYYRFDIPSLKAIEGKFLISELSFEGSHEDAVSFSATFESIGTWNINSSAT